MFQLEGFPHFVCTDTLGPTYEKKFERHLVFFIADRLFKQMMSILSRETASARMNKSFRPLWECRTDYWIDPWPMIGPWIASNVFNDACDAIGFQLLTITTLHSCTNWNTLCWNTIIIDQLRHYTRCSRMIGMSLYSIWPSRVTHNITSQIG